MVTMLESRTGAFLLEKGKSYRLDSQFEAQLVAQGFAEYHDDSLIDDAPRELEEV